MSVRGIAFLIILAQVAPLDVFAQQPEVRPGTRVRVTAPEVDKDRLVGTVRELGDDRLLLKVEHQATPVELPLSSVSKLEVSLGSSSRQSRMLKGAGIGILCGGVVGALIFLARYDEDDNIFEDAGKFYTSAAGGAIVALPCALLGAVIGAATGGEHWRVVEPLTDLGFRILPDQHGGLSVTVARCF